MGHDRRFILALDIGSSSVRARRYGEGLTVIGGPEEAVCRYSWRYEHGAMECDAADLLGCVVDALDAAAARAAADAVPIAAVAITTFWHSLLGLDAGGAPVTPIFGWGDARAAPDARALAARLSEADYHRRTGCFLRPSYPAVKIAWLKRTDRTAFSSVRSWVSFGDYLEDRLFGKLRTSYSIASASGLFDLGAMDWDAETLDVLGIEPARLPALVHLEPASGLRSEWSARWPSLSRVPFFPAVGDGACANVGSGAVGRSHPGLTVGTSAAVRVLRRTERDEAPPHRLWDYRLDREHGVAGGALSNGGNVLAFLLRTFPGLDAGAIDARLRRARPDAHGLTVLPSLLRERGPTLTDGQGATVVGIGPETEPIDIAQAWLEAVAHRIARLYEGLERHFGEAVEVRASGGALHAIPGWLRTIADAIGRPVRLTTDPEATSRGAAIVAARELGWIDALDSLPAEGTIVFDPEPGHHESHREAALREQRLAESIADSLPEHTTVRMAVKRPGSP